MILKRTVLVLGAGASVSAGFELPDVLKRQVLEKVSNPEFKSVLVEIFGFSDFLIDNFVSALEFSGFKYVEDFLAERKEFREIGKYVLSLVIKEQEDIKILFKEGSWYSYLYEALNNSFEDFGKNKLSVITFNFDKSLEAYFYHSLKNSYNKSEGEILKIIKEIPVVHIHGEIGGESWSAEQYGVSLGRRPNKEKIVGNAEKLNLISALNIDNNSNILKARQLLAETEHIVFLGFGYDEINMSKLKISSLEGKSITGSTFGLKSGEIKSIVTRNKGKLAFAKTKLVQGLDVKDFLKESGILGA